MTALIGRLNALDGALFGRLDAALETPIDYRWLWLLFALFFVTKF